MAILAMTITRILSLPYSVIYGYICGKDSDMKHIFIVLRNYFDRRLRERCVKYVSRSCQGTDRMLINEVQSIYKFIKGEN